MHLRGLKNRYLFSFFFPTMIPPKTFDRRFFLALVTRGLCRAFYFPRVCLRFPAVFLIHLLREREQKRVRRAYSCGRVFVSPPYSLLYSIIRHSREMDGPGLVLVRFPRIRTVVYRQHSRPRGKPTIAEGLTGGPLLNMSCCETVKRRADRREMTERPYGAATAERQLGLGMNRSVHKTGIFTRGMFSVLYDPGLPFSWYFFFITVAAGW